MAKATHERTSPRTRTALAASTARTAPGATALGPKRIKVRATQTGYYDHKRRRPGDVFYIDGALQSDPTKRRCGEVAAFSDRWMELVDPTTPLVEPSTPQQAINQAHDDLLGGTVVARSADGSEGASDEGEENPLGAE